MLHQRMLQISIATMTVLGPLLLGAGDRVAAFPVWVLIAAVLSLWLTDFTGLIRLNRTVINLAAAGAVFISFFEFRQHQPGIDIPTVARLLVYLQIILLFQKKEIRTYWQLAVLSLLQVLVAAAFNQGISFGVYLAAYLFVGLTSLTLLFLYRERIQADRRGGSLPSWESSDQRWPLAGREAVFTVAGGGTESGLGRELWMRLARMTVITLILTAAIFVATPRLGSGAWYGTGLSQQRMVGFSDRVTLGELGKVIEDPREVLVVKFVDDATGLPYQIAGGVYLRGALLDTYNAGSWAARTRSSVSNLERSLQPANPLWRDGLVRQEITIEPMDRDELFCVWPFVGLEASEQIKFDGWRQRLIRPGSSDKRFSFALGTNAFDSSFQALITPASQSKAPVDIRRYLRLPPRETIPELIGLAQRTIDEEMPPERDRIARARVLEHVLRDSGEFEYSLKGQPRQLDLDPIEDFIANNPSGHCEYFSTALALMLRSQGIPSRVIVGFKSNEFNRLGDFYQVRQLHAHTWVEAYLTPEHIPPELLLADRPWRWASGGWIRLDATPVARDLGLEAGDSFWGKVDSYFTWLDYIWTAYVMEMDSPRQKERIYTPLTELFSRIYGNLTDPAWWIGVFENALGGLASLFSGRWFDWRAGVAAMVIGLMLAAVFYTFRSVWRALFRRLIGRTDSATGEAEARVEFYRRLEAILKTLGLDRDPAQTQREFARAAETRIREIDGRQNLSSLPRQVVDAFYHVRFGGRDLDRSQSEGIESALSQLAEAANRK